MSVPAFRVVVTPGRPLSWPIELQHRTVRLTWDGQELSCSCRASKCPHRRTVKVDEKDNADDTLVPGQRRVIPNGRYEMVWNGATLFCGCPAFKFQRKPLAARTPCKHMAARFPEYWPRAGRVARKAAVPKLLLFQAFDPDKHSVAGYWWATKYDGVRAVWTGTDLVTRNGTVIDAPRALVDQLPADRVLDGELWAGVNGFEAAQAAAQGTAADAVWAKVTYMVFDCLVKHAALEDRLHTLGRLARDWRPPVALVTYHQVRSLERLEDRLVDLTEQGHEGVVIRSPHGVYRGGRNAYNLKWKVAQFGVGRVTGHKDGQVWWVQPDRDEFRSGAIALVVPLHDTVRQGDRVQFVYRGVTSRGKPKFARFEQVVPGP